MFLFVFWRRLGLKTDTILTPKFHQAYQFCIALHAFLLPLHSVTALCHCTLSMHCLCAAFSLCCGPSAPDSICIAAHLYCVQCELHSICGNSVCTTFQLIQCFHERQTNLGSRLLDWVDYSYLNLNVLCKHWKQCPIDWSYRGEFLHWHWAEIFLLYSIFKVQEIGLG